MSVDPKDKSEELNRCWACGKPMSEHRELREWGNRNTAWVCPAKTSQSAGVSDDALELTYIIAQQMTPGPERELIERIAAALTAERQAHEKELDRVVEQWKARTRYCIDDRNKAEAKLAAAESTREQGHQPASCGIKGHLVMHEIGDEYGHFYCLICSTRDAALVAMVEKCAAKARKVRVIDAMLGYCDVPPHGEEIASDIETILPAEIVASVERERRKLQLEATIAAYKKVVKECPGIEYYGARALEEWWSALEAELKKENAQGCVS